MRNGKDPKRIRKISRGKIEVDCNKTKETYNYMFMKMCDKAKQ